MRAMSRTNMAAQADLFAGGARMIAEEAVDLTIASLEAYAYQHDHWAVAWSCGKDSTATLTLLVNLIEEGRIRRPARLHVFYADTRQELPPLQAAAAAIAEQLRRRDWITVETVMAPLDKGQRAMAVAMIYPEPEKGGRGQKSFVAKEFSGESLSKGRHGAVAIQSFRSAM